MNPLRIGVIGLGRGRSYVQQIVDREDTILAAACDHSPALRDRFHDDFPTVPLCEAFEELLERDIDAVVIASYCPDHAPQAVMALDAGKHVLSEVTAFHTLAEGAELARAVERTGLTYMMGENTCYFPVCEEMKRLCQAGEMGEFMYAECEYVHALNRSVQLNPDGSLHWRFWQPCIYYCTHSLGPIFQMCQDRPVSVTGLNTGMKMHPDWPEFRADVEIGLIRMASGGVVKLLASFANHREPAGHNYLYYGTNGNMETDRMNPSILYVRYGDPERKNKWEACEPSHQRMVEQAARTGHGGADFFVLHDFVDAIQNGSLPPVDVYAAADMTLPGILAFRSACNGGQPFPIPDFRNESERKEAEADTFSPRPKKSPPAD